MSLLTRIRVVISYRALKKNVGAHKSPQEAVKVMKSLTYFVAFPVLCGLTYIYILFLRGWMEYDLSCPPPLQGPTGHFMTTSFAALTRDL